MAPLRSFEAMAILSFLLYLNVNADQSPTNSTARSLDAVLQDYAFRAFVRPRTGIVYDATVPANLTGAKIAAIRLRTGSFRRYGVPTLKEFTIPEGVIVKPYVERLVLVYQNLGNFSHLYYPISGYDYVAPVLGLLPYDARNLSATDLPELEFRASGDPIKIVFSDLRNIPQGSSVKCVRFDLEGPVIFSDVGERGNTCETVQPGHFSIVVKSVAPSPSPAPAGKRKKSGSSKIWIIIGSVIGGLILLGILTFLVLWVRNYKRGKRIREMERAGDGGEVLRTTLVGETRAPTASTTRTQPMLETESTA